MKHTIVTFLLLLFISYPLFSQNTSDWLFDDSVLPEIHITIEQDTLDELLNPDNVLSDHEFPATFEFKKGTESETVENIGFRLRGNTSRYSQKKSFKVSFNTFENGRQYRDLDKMNLNGEHNDPSIIRSKLSWDIFQKIGLPAPRANHVTLYINGEYFGLYINVEHIDDEFLVDRFGTDAGNLYKCLYPADLTYQGPNQSDYKAIEQDGRRAYELKTNEEDDNYADLTFLINFLENASAQKFEQEIEDYLNVDGILQWMAVDILTGMWDDYWFNKNNYYLYNNPIDNRFEFIPYDYDNTFGIWWNGIYPGIDWGTRDINQWGHPDEDRPLTRRILEIEEYRNRLNFYVDKILDQRFNETTLFASIDQLKTMVEDAAEEDVYRTLDYGYSIEDYHASFDEAVGGHVEYGLKPFITTRANSASGQLQLENITPVIRRLISETTGNTGNISLTIQAVIIDEETPEVYAYMTNPITQEIHLTDDGTGMDNEAGDGIYSASVTFEEQVDAITFHVEATDSENYTGRFPNNSERFVHIEMMSRLNSILINEFMADNESVIQDEYGDFEDWIELYNPTDNAINLKNYFLTDNFSDQTKWALPDSTIQPGQFFLVWADNDDEEGPFHTNFGLSNDGEQAGLYYQDVLEILLVDTLSFGVQSDDISYGRETDGADNFVLFDTPTPGTSNQVGTSIHDDVFNPASVELYQNYPNPFNPETIISFSLNTPAEIRIDIYAINGRHIQNLTNSRYSSGYHDIRFDASSLASGVYIYKLKSGYRTYIKKLTVIK